MCKKHEAGEAVSERRRREIRTTAGASPIQGGPGACPPGKFLKSRCQSVQSGAFLAIKLRTILTDYCRGYFFSDRMKKTLSSELALCSNVVLSPKILFQFNTFLKVHVYVKCLCGPETSNAIKIL